MKRRGYAAWAYDAESAKKLWTKVLVILKLKDNQFRPPYSYVISEITIGLILGSSNYVDKDHDTYIAITYLQEYRFEVNNHVFWAKH